MPTSKAKTKAQAQVTKVLAAMAGLSRTDLVIIIGLPVVRSLSVALAAQDSNKTGRDDELARALDAAAVGLETYLSGKP